MDHMGPPGGPKDSWAVYNDTLYMNFQQFIRDKFFSNADANIATANARWIAWWGDMRAGPFNTDCLAETWDGHDCTKEAQLVPPTCVNRCDETSLCGNSTTTTKCSELVKKYSCEEYYCFNCTYSGWCDKACGVCS